MRKTTWAKLPVFHRLMSSTSIAGIDWILSIDSDEIFTNYTCLLEDLVKAARLQLESPEMIIANDVMGNLMNGGFIMMRVSDWSRALLQKWWHVGTEISLRNSWPDEQGSITYLYRSNPEIRKRVFVLPDAISPHFHNSMTFMMRKGMVWKEGDCVVTLLGDSWKTRRRC